MLLGLISATLLSKPRSVILYCGEDLSQTALRETMRCRGCLLPML